MSRSASPLSNSGRAGGQALSRLAALVVGVTLATPAVLDPRLGGSALALGGLLIVLTGRGSPEGGLGPEAKLLFFAAALIAASNLATGAGFILHAFWPLIALPLYVLLQRLPPHLPVVWSGLALGTAITGAGCLLELPVRALPVAAAQGVALLLAAMAIAPGLWRKRLYGLAGLAMTLLAAAGALAAGASIAAGAMDAEFGPLLGGRDPLAGALLLAGVILPGRAFASALRRPDSKVRALGVAGLAALTGWLILSVAGLALAEPATSTLWVVTIAGLLGSLHAHERVRLAEPVTRRHRLSATVICMNEADRIRTCLDSLAGWVDEIVVLDSGSTDGTPRIAREYTSRVEVTDWPGYGPQKQRALERATGDWVLSIDADEAVTPELRHDIDTALSVDAPSCVAYRLPWAVTVYGKRLDFGRSARAPLRLFRREGARFSDDLVHETVLVPPGPITQLRGRLLHFTHRDFGHALQKSAQYAWLGAQKKYRKHPRSASLGLATLVGAVRFLHIYVLRLGFLDGPVGFLVAATYSQGAFNKYAGAWTLRRQARMEERKPRNARNTQKE